MSAPTPDAVRKLSKLVVRYCDWGGSSRGVRAYITDHIIDFAKAAPQVEVATEIKRNKHPVLVAEYSNGNEKVISVRNHSARQVQQFVKRVYDEDGRKVTKIGKPISTRYPTIQGMWDVEVPYQQVKYSLDYKSQGRSQGSDS